MPPNPDDVDRRNRNPREYASLIANFRNIRREQGNEPAIHYLSQIIAPQFLSRIRAAVYRCGCGNELNSDPDLPRRILESLAFEPVSSAGRTTFDLVRDFTDGQVCKFLFFEPGKSAVCRYLNGLGLVPSSTEPSEVDPSDLPAPGNPAQFHTEAVTRTALDLAAHAKMEDRVLSRKAPRLRLVHGVLAALRAAGDKVEKGRRPRKDQSGRDKPKPIVSAFCRELETLGFSVGPVAGESILNEVRKWLECLDPVQSACPQLPEPLKMGDHAVLIQTLESELGRLIAFEYMEDPKHD